MKIYMSYGMQWEPNGRIVIDTDFWFREKNSLADFKKLLRIAQQSDREHGTTTVDEWAAAIRDEQDRLRQEEQTATDEFELECDAIRREYAAKLEAALEKLKNRQRKQILSSVKRMEKTKKMLELLEDVKHA